MRRSGGSLRLPLRPSRSERPKRWYQFLLRRFCCLCGDDAPREKTPTLRRQESAGQDSEESGGADAAAAALAREQKGQLVNDLLVAQWPFISKWFEEIMKAQVEPLLQKFMPAGIKISFGEDCSLGTTPMQLQRVTSATYVEDSLEGEELTNIRIGGSVNWCGDSKVDVEITGGSIAGKDLSLKAPIVIELVKLRTKPPWFSGVRIYFPDVPAIDLTVEAKVLGMNSSVGFVKRKLVKALATLICRHAVLPNRFAVGFGDGIDTFNLKHPRPQGVLRLAVVEAVALRPYTGAPWWRFDARKEATADPYVEVSVGAASRTTKAVKKILTPKWDEEAVFDFVCDNPEKQSVCIVVRDEDYGLFSWKPSDFLGRATMDVARLVERQRPERGTRVPELWMQLRGETHGLPRGRLRVRAQWRAFADEWELDSVSATPSLWTIGVPTEAAFYLAVDVYHATALPSSGDGLLHWASLSVAGGQLPGARALQPSETHSVAALPPGQHGLALLHRQNVPQEVIEAFEEDPQRAHALWRRRVQAGDLTPEQEGRCGGLVDAVWERSLFFLVDSLEAATLRVSVLRQAKGKTRADGGVALGSAECRLSSVAECDRWTKDVILPLGQGEAAGFAHVKLRLQLRPLRAPALLHEGLLAAARDTIGNGIGKVAAGAQTVAGISRRLARLPSQAFPGTMAAIDFSSGGTFRRSLRFHTAEDGTGLRFPLLGQTLEEGEEGQEQDSDDADGREGRSRWRGALGAFRRRSRQKVQPEEALPSSTRTLEASAADNPAAQSSRNRFPRLRWAVRAPSREWQAPGAASQRATGSDDGVGPAAAAESEPEPGGPLQRESRTSMAARRRRFFQLPSIKRPAKPEGQPDA